MQFESLAKAKKYLKEKGQPYNSGGLSIYRREGKRVKYKYVVCTHLEWLNGFFGGIKK